MLRLLQKSAFTCDDDDLSGLSSKGPKASLYSSDVIVVPLTLATTSLIDVVPQHAGTLVDAWADIPGLQVLDLSHNSFIGSLASQLGQGLFRSVRA